MSNIQDGYTMFIFNLQVHFQRGLNEDELKRRVKEADVIDGKTTVIDDNIHPGSSYSNNRLGLYYRMESRRTVCLNRLLDLYFVPSATTSLACCPASDERLTLGHVYEYVLVAMMQTHQHNAEGDPESGVAELQMKVESLKQELHDCKAELAKLQKQLSHSERLQKNTENYNEDLRKQVGRILQRRR